MERATTKYLTLEERQGVAILDVTAQEIDNPTLARELGGELDLVLQIKPSDRILIDFSQTKYMSSTAFAVLLGFAKRAGEAGIKLGICGFIPQVRFGADVLGIGRIVPIHESRVAGIKALAQ